MSTTPLPFVDEHSVIIDADAGRVWAALHTALDRSFSGVAAVAYAHAVGCADTSASGPRPLAEGSSIPGFHVIATEPNSLLALTGRHRFSTYALTLRIDESPTGRSRLRAETRASFPGVFGRAYRTLVIATGAHAIGLRRFLSGIRAAAERAARSPRPSPSAPLRSQEL